MGKIMHKLILTCLFLLISVPCFGQEIKVWNFTEDSKHHNSTVKVITEVGNGTGVIVRIYDDKPTGTGFQGVVLTAYHVVKENYWLKNSDHVKNIKVKYSNGKQSKDCQIISSSDTFDSDIALLTVWVPSGLEAIKLAGLPAKSGDYLEFAGLGGSVPIKDLRHFYSLASLPTTDEGLFSDTIVIQGDSGGPVFNSKNELVGVISGGWFMVDQFDIKNSKATWPAKATNLNPIKKLLKELDN